ncbi:MAG: hypothetical protein ACI9YR_001165 [Bacteroidia bacterium]|jgi:hypothetical protein
MTVAAIELSNWLRGELRSDQAGETCAVWIYRGVLATNLAGAPPGRLAARWCYLVGAGSEIAVKLARRV